jgi:hypothetical protein
MSDQSESQEKSLQASVHAIENGESVNRRGRRNHLSLTRWVLLVLFILCILGLALGLGLGLGLKHSSPSSPSNTNQTSSNVTNLEVGTTFDYALGFNLTVPIANASTTFYSTDLQNTAGDTIVALTAAGHYVACYFSAGSIESYRPDADQIPSEAVGNVMEGWPDEKWLDVRNAGVRSVMTSRLKLAQSKGCHGVDADNIDGYANDSGFDMSEDDAVNYVQFLATQANGLGLAYGLKNGGDLISRVLNVSAWVVNEQCAAFDECDLYEPFIQAGKPVFHIEYTDDEDATAVNTTFKDTSCGANGQAGFSTIIKHMNLDNWAVDCN